MDTWEAALNGRIELEQYGNNRLLLFALALHQDIDDIELIANDALTDGRNDKKCDLVYVNRESGKVIIGQGYWASGEREREAPANKASDLNTAASWIFSSDAKGIPDKLRAAVEQVHLALQDEQVTSIEFWYVHNCRESANVKAELGRVAQTADSLCRRYFPNADVDSIVAIEVGRDTIETWYRGTQAPILVTGKFQFETRGGFSTEGRNWSAYSTSVPAEWLRNMFQVHGKELFSANVRDYLGSRRSDKNINNNIKNTAANAPDMFWVYNNGITALVNDFEYTSEDDLGVLEVSGIAIVNGAQTTGALGTSEDSDLSNAFVPARFVKCSDSSTVRDIIRFNNSQNKIAAADFRSNDSIQSRLRSEFDAMPDVEYSGGRRGGEEDAMRRPRSSISSYTAAQALMAFHGDPVTAYNQRSQIWQSDSLYSKIFNDNLSAAHTLCAYALLKAVDEAKAALRMIPDIERTNSQSRYWEIVRQRGATFLLTAAIASGLETIIGRPIPSKFSIRFRTVLSVTQAIDNWRPVVDLTVPFVGQLANAFSGGNMTNRDTVTSAINNFVDMLEAVRTPNAIILDAFAEQIMNRTS